MSYNSKYTGAQVEALLDKVSNLSGGSDSGINMIPFTLFALNNINGQTFTEDEVINGSSKTQGYPLMCKKAYVGDDGNLVFEKFTSLQEAYDTIYPYTQPAQFESFYITLHDVNFNLAAVNITPIVQENSGTIIMGIYNIPQFPTVSYISLGFSSSNFISYNYDTVEIADKSNTYTKTDANSIFSPKVTVTDLGSVSSASLDADTFYTITAGASLSITLNTASPDNKMHIYAFQITTTAATALTISGVTWLTDNTCESNKTYQVSVLNGFAIMTSNASTSSAQITPSGDPMHYAYEAIGAIYNNTSKNIKYDAPWADMLDSSTDKDAKITHKPGCWYYNYIGDLTNDDMRDIFIEGPITLDDDIRATAFPGQDKTISGKSRTIKIKDGVSTALSRYIGAYNSKLEVFGNFPFRSMHNNASNMGKQGYPISVYSFTDIFKNCSKLKFILVPIENILGDTFGLVSINLKVVKFITGNDDNYLALPYCTNITVKSIVYMLSKGQLEMNYDSVDYTNPDEYYWPSSLETMTLKVHVTPYNKAMSNNFVVYLLNKYSNIALTK